MRTRGSCESEVLGVLVGVQARDPTTFATAPSILVLVALIALALPAFRASRVDPVRTLREECPPVLRALTGL
jgi:hypothetical protein